MELALDTEALVVGGIQGFMRAMLLQVGSRVRQRRERAGISQAALGGLVGKSLETIGRIERGVTAPSLELLEKLALALKVDPRDLLGPGDYAPAEAGTPLVEKLITRLYGLSAAELERAEKLLTIGLDWAAD